MPEKRVPRNRYQLIQDREEVAELLALGYTQAQIAERQTERYKQRGLNIVRSQQMVSYDFKRWLADRRERTDGAVEKEIALCDRQIRELNEAWERSKTPKYKEQKKVTTTRAQTQSGAGNLEKTETTEYQCGHPAYMTEISKAADRRCKLEGAYAPEKIETEQRQTVIYEIPDNKRENGTGSDKDS